MRASAVQDGSQKVGLFCLYSRSILPL
jgi:hypothetical protein